ncbi:sensor histidine kinase [Ornithinimicrobium sp. Arc0846-15]|nr:sensor histidine kinase [Ornithinimicrobium laminariae]
MDSHLRGARDVASAPRTGSSVTPGAAESATDAPSKPDGWERWGWLMAVIWLPFLVFSIAGIIDFSDGLRRVVALALVAAFAGFYVHGFVWRFGTMQPTYATAMGLCILGVGMLTGLDGFTWIVPAMAPFVISFSWYNTRVRFALIVTVAALGYTLGVIIFLEPQAWTMLLLNGGIALVTGLPRILDDQQEHKQALQREADRSAERERMARDIHDILGHSLTIISLKSELAEKLIVAKPDAAAQEVRQIHEISRKALSEVRASVQGLRVAWLPDELRSAREMLASANITATVPDDPNVVEPQNRTVMAWALREAVTNVARHSGANNCSVSLSADQLIVLDDGSGLTGRTEGNGLRGLRERVDAAGGTLVLNDNSDGPGTRVEVTL